MPTEANPAKLDHRADNASVGDRTKQLARELRDANFRFNQKLVELAYLYEAGVQLSSSLEREEVISGILPLAVATLDARGGFLLSRDEATGRLNLEQEINLGGRQQLASKDQSLRRRRALRDGGTVHLDRRQLPAGFGAEHLSAAAMGDAGIIFVFDKETFDGVVAFGDLDGRILELMAQQAGTALANASLHRHIVDGREAGAAAVSGYINNMGGEQIAEAVDELLDEGVNRFVFDLEQCRIVNSIGISILIEVIEKVLETEGRVLFCSVSPTITKTFRIMGLLQRSDICDTRAQALASG